MNQAPGDHWRGQGPPSSGENQQANRPYGAFGSGNGSTQQPHVLPPPPSSGFPLQHGQPQSGHAGDRLSIADLTAGVPAQSQYNTAPPPAHSQSHPLSSLSANLPHQSPEYGNREREIRELRAREEMRERERQEREARDRHLERLSREQQQAPLQSHVGSLPLHQPVASKVQGSLQGPNGLLGGGGAGVHTTNAPVPLSQQYPQHQLPPQSAAPNYLTQPPPATAHSNIAGGQQPILNDALSYLDQVKVRFSDQPDVYNRFLDIMKDFKSQAIDTPGVISRVSELFNGHPELIQGFNTFLPPGYRIECGTADNPDAIRVTTPSGTISHSLQNRNRDPFDTMPPAGLPRQDTVESTRSWAQQISPAARHARLPGYDPDSEAMLQDQRNVSQLQNAASAAANGHTRPAQGSSPIPGQQGLYPQQASLFGNGADIKRGGPVEFNHAISYVNKIKNRFVQQPEIYKQFLEILQTYQRESKPIQDVYAQVTQLFISAPDLLEDFKQFLPESAAHAKAQAAARAQQADAETSSARNEPYSGTLPQTQTPRPNPKMPPMGQFDPPSTTKDNKKRKAPVPAASQPQPQSTQEARGRGMDAQPASKKQKFDNKQKNAELPIAPPVDPTLVPALPEPLPPSSTASTSQEELGFFERAKKQIGNRASYAEFLKLINLYSQDIIDKYVLADRVQSFIGSQSDLMAYFRGVLGIEEQDEIVEARMRSETGRVNLAHCRAYGPSYRHLPKRDQNKTCKGRDGMCYEVLNDVWASHPTWASEDSGFVAHRKNQYEESLHRIEEERHDYDFHIESCLRTIQLMEPLVQQINVMSDEGRANFRVDKTFGGASEAIPKRVILKIYGREVGNQVLNDLFVRPAQVMPTVLNRLKQKLEEWKQVQREWEKVWRDQINKQFWRSLDHQGIAQRNADKKNFQQKTLTSEIQAKYEEQKRSRDQGARSKTYQLEYQFADEAVLMNTTQLILAGLEVDKSDINSNVQTKIKSWLQDFVVKFFGLEREQFIDDVDAAVQQVLSPSEDRVDEADSDAQASTSRKARSAIKTSESLRHRALMNRNGKEDSLAPTSKESTPVPEAPSTTSTEQEHEQSGPEEAMQHRKWIRLNKTESRTIFQELELDDAYPHETFNFYANSNLYCFFRLFEMLYSRLLAVKKDEVAVVEAVRRFRGDGMAPKAALPLRMVDKTPQDFFKEVDGSRTYYDQIVEMSCEVLLGRVDRDYLEETLRRYYNKSGWQLYMVDKHVHAILRFLNTIMVADSKERSLEIANLFFKDRERQETTRKIELQYRNAVKRMSKDHEVFRITWNPTEKSCTIRLFPPDDTTFDSNELSDEAQWQTYVASYTMSEPTEGIDPAKVRRPYLQRNIPLQSSNPQISYAENIDSLNHTDQQFAYIGADTYKLYLSGIFAFERQGVRASGRYLAGEQAQSEPFREKFVRNVVWMKDQPMEAVEARLAAWERGLREGLQGFEDQFMDQ
ncbi:Transcriptional regulatory protein sin3 [Lithohypha guttulata]|uniref:Transcriptional regulatory protein sin3 n=1 Tax=Lithohypha guttulata TaxID=1690604 RepID=A0AAN7T294_9EURO|nr:Transcriptional regulatory protein sin3 [Lithohypha guttulata]